ncbi:hypothetical protein GZH49_12610 [Nocardia terpenica]|uniref:hypothetical protein n=1 Tax=Nocardia terpenica TaxID=455432 RepID=UPI002FE1333A
MVPATPGVPAPTQQPGQPPAAPDDSTGSGTSGNRCGVTHISDCVAGAIDGFFHRLVDSALNPLLSLLSQTLLTTPDPLGLPQVAQVWSSSWQLVLAMYGLVVIAAGILLMAHETLQTRWDWRELLPRLVAGFLAGALSLTFATEAVRFANGLAAALGGDGVSADSAAGALRSMMHVGTGSEMNLFATLMLTALAVVLVVLLITYVIRVAITIVLIVAAPLAMMCYALPATESVARWWWRSFSACLAIQVVQSLVLVTGLRVFLSPGGWEFFGPTESGWVSIIIALAMGLMLVKIPFWLLSALKISSGHGLVSSVVRGFVRYKTFGLVLNAGRTPSSDSRRRRTAHASTDGGDPAGTDPYAHVRATRGGQLMLPLPGVRRVKRPPPTPSAPVAPAGAVPAATPPGEQLMLPLPAFHGGVDLGPKPRLGRDGQYRLPITVERVPKPTTAVPPKLPTPTSKPVTGTRGPRPKQLAFDFTAPADPDPYAGLRPLRGGQYPLPIEVRRVPAPRTTTPPPPLAAPESRSTGRQLHLPFPDLPVRRRPRRTRGGSK